MITEKCIQSTKGIPQEEWAAQIDQRIAEIVLPLGKTRVNVFVMTLVFSFNTFAM